MSNIEIKKLVIKINNVEVKLNELLRLVNYLEFKMDVLAGKIKTGVRKK